MPNRDAYKQERYPSQGQLSYHTALTDVDSPSGKYKEQIQAGESKEDIKVVGLLIIWGLNLEESAKIESRESGDKESEGCIEVDR